MLFVDAPAATVQEFAALDPKAWLQFHGDEDAEFCASFGRPYLKALRPQSAADFDAACAAHPAAEAIILDGGGGSGEAFDWSLVPPPAGRPKPLMLAGGISPANAAAAVARTRPDWIDVSSGVCADGEPRRKDPAKLAA
ncbi:MAG: N-(5'-phosphoribosyl)anthranilate isomerase, partial [Betaproteobacteria bacterium AqS2]|nr:N-(5'-phosphoribosyl)anthranilate isomerase [Betaproteobacteria bacterium AqS2]